MTSFLMHFSFTSNSVSLHFFLFLYCLPFASLVSVLPLVIYVRFVLLWLLLFTVFTGVIHALFLTKILYLNLGCVIYVRRRFYVNKSGYTGNFLNIVLKAWITRVNTVFFLFTLLDFPLLSLVFILYYSSFLPFLAILFSIYQQFPFSLYMIPFPLLASGQMSPESSQQLQCRTCGNKIIRNTHVVRKVSCTGATDMSEMRGTACICGQCCVHTDRAYWATDVTNHSENSGKYTRHISNNHERHTLPNEFKMITTNKCYFPTQH